MRPAYKQKNPTISNVKSLDLWSEWRESNSRPLEPHCASLENTMYNPILPRLSIVKFQMYYIILFHWMSRRFIPFVVKLWSNGPDKWPFSPAKLHRAISIFINRSCAFCLHELSIRRICQPCQWIIVVFSSLTELYDPWLLLRTGRRTLFVLPHSKGSFSGAAVSRSVNRCQNSVRHPAWPHEPFC